MTEEKPQLWVFTFGIDKQMYGDRAGKHVKIFGTFASARKQMINRYNLKWAFQYSEKEWKRMGSLIGEEYHDCFWCDNAVRLYDTEEIVCKSNPSDYMDMHFDKPTNCPKGGN